MIIFFYSMNFKLENFQIIKKIELEKLSFEFFCIIGVGVFLLNVDSKHVWKGTGPNNPLTLYLCKTIYVS